MSCLRHATPGSRDELGLSLVELLVALVLGLLLSSAMVSVFLSGKTNYLLDQELAGIQENGRFALGLLQRELALAGFVGALPAARSLPAVRLAADCAALPWALDLSLPVQLIPDFSGPVVATPAGTSLTCLRADELMVGADLLVTKRTAAEATLLNGRFHPGGGAPKATQWYLRSAGFGAETSWLYVGEEARFPSGVGVGSGVSYWEMQSNIYYVRKFSSAGDALPTLCVEQLAANAMATRCLVEGIEDMQLEFGIDADADGVVDHYDHRPTALALRRAVAARLYLLVRSREAIAGYRDRRSYRLGRKEVAATDDGYLRRVFSTTVRLRNSALPVI